ncbi:MAG: hypothetical protein H7240_00265 [Glaciimonas sp.]|nr:hypothetical protein [Glaciimonas sp.]
MKKRWHYPDDLYALFMERLPKDMDTLVRSYRETQNTDFVNAVGYAAAFSGLFVGRILDGSAGGTTGYGRGAGPRYIYKYVEADTRRMKPQKLCGMDF